MTKDNSNTLSILIATDNHLGYAEKDVLRTNDSFDTFEEILRIGREREVDCLLIGGDLFHENRPSRKTLNRILELLRHYCMGSRPCAVELLSDPAVNFPSKFGTVNYEDPNYNIALPVFAIHGNHDDPTGDGNLSPIDLLATAGLLNYFGKTSTVDEITITPVLLRKGRTKLALYGLGAVRDERLHRTFLQRKIKMLRPPEPDSWFNMMILHQNRVAHGPTNYIPEHFLDEFLDLVVWGHEHECQACDPTSCPQRGFTVCQPGSSVATSLSEGETREKHVVVLEIRGREMNLIPIPLTSVRPFIMRDIILRDIVPKIDIHDTKKINQYLSNQVEEMIRITQEDWREKQDKMPENRRKEFPLPLIRLRIDYSAELDTEGFASVYAIMNPQRFGQQFINRIANPRDVAYFVRRRTLAIRKKENTKEKPMSNLEGDRAEMMRVEDLVSQFLTSQKLDLFPQNEFCDIVRVAVEKDDRDAIENFVKQSIERTLSTVRATVLEKDTIKSEFERSRKLREDEWIRLHPGIDDLIANKPKSTVTRLNNNNDADDNNCDDSEEENESNDNRSIAMIGTTRPEDKRRGKGPNTGGKSINPKMNNISSAISNNSPAPSPKRRNTITNRASRPNKLEFTIESDEEIVPSTPSTKNVHWDGHFLANKI